jgi:hypothetical protein
VDLPFVTEQLDTHSSKDCAQSPGFQAGIRGRCHLSSSLEVTGNAALLLLVHSKEAENFAVAWCEEKEL